MDDKKKIPIWGESAKQEACDEQEKPTYEDSEVVEARSRKFAPILFFKKVLHLVAIPFIKIEKWEYYPALKRFLFVLLIVVLVVQHIQINELQDSLKEVEVIAKDAQSAAEDAQYSADEAQSAAEDAQSTAEDAQSAAEDARTENILGW